MEVSLSASIGVLQTPGLYGFVHRRYLAVSPVTRNRRLSDACLMDGIAVIGDLIGLKVML